MMKITEDMMIYEVLDINQDLEDILLKHGLACAGCPGSNMENLRDAAEGHGINLEELLIDLNKANEI